MGHPRRPGSHRWLALPALLLLGCPPPPPVARPYPPPTAQALLARLDQQAARLGVLRSDSKVDYRGQGGERVKVSMAFLSRPPDHLRVEVSSPLAGAVASLASDGRDFQLLDTRNGRFLGGPASACNLARLLQVALAPADVVAVLGGSAPRLAEVARIEAGWDGEGGGREVLTLHAPDGATETLRFDAREQRWDLLQAELRAPGGEVVWRIDHADFQADGSAAGGGLRLPGRSEVAQPARGADAKVRFRSREAGGEAADALFHLAPPAGLAVETVGCP